MLTMIKKILYTVMLSIFVLIPCVLPLSNFTEAKAPKFQQNFESDLTKGWLLNPKDRGVGAKNQSGEEQTLRDNIVALFYPGGKSSDNGLYKNYIYKVIRDMTLWLMIVYIIRAGASLLFNKKPETMTKTLNNFIYIVLWWAFVYWANRLFWSVFNFNSSEFVSWENWFWWVTNALIWEWSVFFFVLSALKVMAFFFAIMMVVITWIRVIGAGEAEKWKKLVKWLINVVVALLIIKWVDFVYYLAADSNNFVENASNFIINVAKIFGYIYGVIIVIMVFVAWYLYITDGWNGNNFKKAGTILVNILLSWLVLFAFLLILYQVFAEFQTNGDAVALLNLTRLYA